MNVVLERDSPIPLFLQIEEELRGLISSGELPSLSMLPSENEFTDQFGVSRMTVRKALDRLVGEGVLFRRPGKGTFVAPPRIEHQPSQALSFSGLMTEHGLQSATLILESGMAPVPAHVGKMLRVAPGDRAVFLRRLRFVEGEPAAIHQSYLPNRWAAVLGHDLSGSLTSILKSLGAYVSEVHDTLEAVAASKYDAHLLKTREGAPLVHIAGLATGPDGEPVRYSEALYRGDRFAFKVDNLRSATVRAVQSLGGGEVAERPANWADIAP